MWDDEEEDAGMRASAWQLAVQQRADHPEGPSAQTLYYETLDRWVNGTTEEEDA